ncbi:MAG: sulfurtransferase [Pseudomonadota bacterium]
MSEIPLLLDVARAQTVMAQQPVCLVDLQSGSNYAQAHLPGARNLDYATLVRSDGRAGGLLVERQAFTTTMQSIGLDSDTLVIAYDAEGGAAASRLVWTLHCYSHEQAVVLDGGIHAWAAAQLPLASGAANIREAGTFDAQLDDRWIIALDDLRQQFDEPSLTVLDARTIEEFMGAKVFAARGGHIPGAVHFEWTEALDPQNNYCLKPKEQLIAKLSERGITPDSEIVVHCQTHRRSSFSYVMLRHLGFPQVRAYAGSWSEWGNHPDTPITVGPPTT